MIEESVVKENTSLNESPVADVLTALVSIGGIAASSAAIVNWQEKLKKKNHD